MGLNVEINKGVQLAELLVRFRSELVFTELAEVERTRSQLLDITLVQLRFQVI